MAANFALRSIRSAVSLGLKALDCRRRLKRDFGLPSSGDGEPSRPEASTGSSLSLASASRRLRSRVAASSSSECSFVEGSVRCSTMTASVREAVFFSSASMFLGLYLSAVRETSALLPSESLRRPSTDSRRRTGDSWLPLSFFSSLSLRAGARPMDAAATPRPAATWSLTLSCEPFLSSGALFSFSLLPLLSTPTSSSFRVGSRLARRSRSSGALLASRWAERSSSSSDLRLGSRSSCSRRGSRRSRPR